MLLSVGTVIDATVPVLTFLIVGLGQDAGITC
jgi:hypothetical protein